ncbi:hypothetical protein V6259_18895 [Marinomonas sp. TI.3.20]|uniref:hypothetical protein n=1 Tax=Marinomonas sp. TI.3.20 TaxID=3121296 RepID=UPI00311EED30
MHILLFFLLVFSGVALADTASISDKSGLNEVGNSVESLPLNKQKDDGWVVPQHVAKWLSPKINVEKPILFIDYNCLGWKEYRRDALLRGNVNRFNYVLIGASVTSRSSLYQALWNLSSGAALPDFYKNVSDIGCQENCSSFKSLGEKHDIDFENVPKDLLSRFARMGFNYQVLTSLAKKQMTADGKSFDEKTFRPYVPALYYKDKIYYPTSIKEIDKILGDTK